MKHEHLQDSLPWVLSLSSVPDPSLTVSSLFRRFKGWSLKCLLWPRLFLLNLPLHNNDPALLPTYPPSSSLSLLSSFVSDLLFPPWGMLTSMLQQLTFSILFKWSPFTKSTFHLSVLIACVCLPYNTLCTVYWLILLQILSSSLFCLLVLHFY